MRYSKYFIVIANHDTISLDITSHKIAETLFLTQKISCFMINRKTIFLFAKQLEVIYEIRAFVKQKISHYYNLKTSHLITKKRLVLLFQWRYSVKQWWH